MNTRTLVAVMCVVAGLSLLAAAVGVWAGPLFAAIAGGALVVAGLFLVDVS